MHLNVFTHKSIMCPSLKCASARLHYSLAFRLGQQPCLFDDLAAAWPLFCLPPSFPLSRRSLFGSESNLQVTSVKSDDQSLSLFSLSPMSILDIQYTVTD
jgi:hypothetical protein